MPKACRKSKNLHRQVSCDPPTKPTPGGKSPDEKDRNPCQISHQPPASNLTRLDKTIILKNRLLQTGGYRRRRGLLSS